MTLSEYYSKFFTGDPVKTNPKQEGEEKTSGKREIRVSRAADMVRSELGQKQGQIVHKQR